MGLNFYAVCHSHREAMFVSRGDEHKGLHSFYRAHDRCAAANPGALQVQGDGYTEQEWMDVNSGYAQFYFTTEPAALPALDDDRVEKWGMGYRVRESEQANA